MGKVGKKRAAAARRQAVLEARRKKKEDQKNKSDLQDRRDKANKKPKTKGVNWSVNY